MKCYKCQSENKVKAGFTRGLQRYKCKDCGCFYSVERKSDVKTAEQKRLALEMYLEGLGFRSIGRILKINYGTVFQWVKKWEMQTELPKSDERIEIVGLNEIHSYSIKKLLPGLAGVDRFGKHFIDFVCGNRDTETFKKLWDILRDKKINRFCSDYWKSYTELIFNEKHIQPKAETFTVEGYNSRMRHYLARFERKGKCYSKSKYMMKISLKLLCLKLNNQLCIIN